MIDCLSLRDPLFLGSQLIAGLASGGIYALVALGLVLIYKSSQVVNFAQGDLLLVGAYLGWALTTAGLPFPLAFVLTLLLAALLGVLVERLVLRRLVGSPTIAVIIVTLGLSSMLRGLVFFVANTEVRRFPDDIFGVTPLPVGPFVVPPIHAWALLLAGLAVLGLTLFFKLSRHGLALRAVADDPRAALSMGIRISRTFALSWALSAAVAATGGILLGNLTGVNFTLADVGLQVFPVVILGGLDSLLGAIVGGLAIGVLQNIASGVLDPCVGGGLKSVMPFFALLAILLFKPYGLFGRMRIERA
jgi:branched-chain amino acid transport system permease protein